MSAWTRIGPAARIGGEVCTFQTSEAYFARWTHPLVDGKYAVVTRYCYVAERPGEPRRLEEQTEYTACADPTQPGGTTWLESAYGYRSVPWTGPFDDAAARAAAGQAPEPTVAEWVEAMSHWELAS